MLSIHEIFLSGTPEGDISLRETFKEEFDGVQTQELGAQKVPWKG